MGASSFGPTQVSDGSDSADVLDLPNNNAVAVAIVNGNGDQITSFGGGGGASHVDKAIFTPSTDDGVVDFGFLDDVAPSTLSEGEAGAIRATPNRAKHVNLRNQSGTEVGTSTDPLRFDPTGATTQPVSAASLPLPSGAATSANQTTEITSLQLIDDIIYAMNGAFNKAAGIAGQLDDTATTAATEDGMAPVRITPQRALHSNLRNQSGTEIGTASEPVRTDPTGTTTQPISGTVDTELPTAAALADNVANPTVPAVGAFLMGWDVAGSSWDRVTVGQASADNLTAANLQGLSAISTVYLYDGANFDRWRGDTANGGDVDVTRVIPGTGATNLGKAEDAAHADGDTLVGVAAVRNDNLGTTFSGTNGDYTPVAVSARGGLHRAIYRSTTTLTALNTVYNNTTTTATSSSIDAEDANEVLLMFQGTESGAATDIQIEVEVSDDNSTFFPWRKLVFVKYFFDDGTISAYGTLSEAQDIPLVARYLRFKVTATGTDATNTFTIANARATIANTR